MKEEPMEKITNESHISGNEKIRKTQIKCRGGLCGKYWSGQGSILQANSRTSRRWLGKLRKNSANLSVFGQNPTMWTVRNGESAQA